MKSGIGNLIFTVAAVILALIFIGLTLKQTNFEVLKSAAKRADYTWFASSMVIGIFAYWLRAARWKLLLNPLGYDFPVKSGFWAISFGYFMNMTIPRSGEIARATSLYKMENVPADKSIGTIVLERVIDLIFLLIFVGLTLIFNANTLYSFFALGEKPSLTKYSIILGLILLIIITYLTFRKRLKKMSFYLKIESFIKGIWTGFLSILHLKKRTEFILYSFGIWICYFFMTFLIVYAFPETSDYGLPEGFFLVVAGALGMILPAVAGLGYPYVMSMAFVAIYVSSGLTAEEGQTVGNYFGLLLYFAQIISMLIFGLLSLHYIAKREKMTKFG